MKTTVVLPDALFRRAKAETALQGRTFTAILLDAVSHELDAAAGKPVTPCRVSLPLIKSRHPGSLVITGDTVAEALNLHPAVEWPQGGTRDSKTGRYANRVSHPLSESQP